MSKEYTEQYRYVIGTLGESWIDPTEKKISWKVRHNNRRIQR